MKTEVNSLNTTSFSFVKLFFLTVCNVVKDPGQYSEITCTAYTFIIVLSVSSVDQPMAMYGCRVY